jgi:long-chain acyl-CoA synthetase
VNNVASFLDTAAASAPDTVFLIHGGRRYTYSQVKRLADHAASGLLNAGFGYGDRIALACINRPGFVVAYYAILKIGATAVVLSTGLQKPDLVIQLRDSGAVALLCHDGPGTDSTAYADLALQAASEIATIRTCWVIPHDMLGASPCRDAATLASLLDEASPGLTTLVPGGNTAIIPYTSGTTGRPKGVEITHDNMIAMAAINVPLADWEDCRVRLVANPLFHIMGQVNSLTVPAFCGQTLVLMEKFDPVEAFRLMAQERITYIAGAPLLYRMLLDNAGGNHTAAIRHHLRLCATGAAPMPKAWSDEFEERFGQPLLSGYGATETTSVISWNRPGGLAKTGTVGQPVKGVDVRIVDDEDRDVPLGHEGQIIARSPGVMKGYLGRPEATATVLRDGWYRSGDLGYLDEEGYLTWTGRVDDVIVRWTGTNVSPAELENVLTTHPLVAQAAVVGVQEPGVGRKVAAVIVLKPGAPIDEPMLRLWLCKEIPENQMPDLFRFRSSLPMTATGKVARHLVAADAAL